jgi:phage gp36-like protein
MIDLFGAPEMVQLSNLDLPGAQGVNEDRVEVAIESADSLIDSYLSAQLTLPLPPAPETGTDDYGTIRRILKTKSMDIARYILESRGEPRPDVKMRYDLAIEWLRMVAKGEIEVKASASAESGGVGSADAAIQYRAAPRVFTRDSLRGYTDNWGGYQGID